MSEWSERGGIVGRGVLIDYVAYAERHGIKYSPVATHHITVEALEEAAKEQSLEFKPGDILLVRSGVVKWHNAQTDASKIEEAIGRKTEFVGVQGCKKTVQWIWNRHFAALAGDTPAFESLPITAENQYSMYPISLPPLLSMKLLLFIYSYNWLTTSLQFCTIGACHTLAARWVNSGTSRGWPRHARLRRDGLSSLLALLSTFLEA
jgi:hypothetical protein